MDRRRFLTLTGGTLGTRVVATTTDPAGEYLAFVPPGAYTVRVNGAGYEPVTAAATIRDSGRTRVDLRLGRAVARAGSGRTVAGPQSQATTADVVLSNDLVSLAVSAGSNDSQLNGVTVGKPLDLAAIGHLDQLDWMNLPYASAVRPRGSNAWQQLTVRSATMEIVSATSARATGASTAVPDIGVVTTYSIAGGEPWVVAESVFTNHGSVPKTFWVGDVIDHDGAGQRSGVAGHGIITLAEPADFTPSAPWIGMTGSDRQTYGLLYTDTAFTAYACGIWAMSQREITLEPGAAYPLLRRIVAVDSGDSDDPFAILGRL